MTSIPIHRDISTNRSFIFSLALPSCKSQQQGVRKQCVLTVNRLKGLRGLMGLIDLPLFQGGVGGP